MLLMLYKWLPEELEHSFQCQKHSHIVGHLPRQSTVITSLIVGASLLPIAVHYLTWKLVTMPYLRPTSSEQTHSLLLKSAAFGWPDLAENQSLMWLATNPLAATHYGKE